MVLMEVGQFESDVQQQTNIYTHYGASVVHLSPLVASRLEQKALLFSEHRYHMLSIQF